MPASPRVDRYSRAPRSCWRARKRGPKKRIKVHSQPRIGSVRSYSSARTIPLVRVVRLPTISLGICRNIGHMVFLIIEIALCSCAMTLNVCCSCCTTWISHSSSSPNLRGIRGALIKSVQRLLESSEVPEVSEVSEVSEVLEVPEVPEGAGAMRVAKIACLYNSQSERVIVTSTWNRSTARGDCVVLACLQNN